MTGISDQLGCLDYSNKIMASIMKRKLKAVSTQKACRINRSCIFPVCIFLTVIFGIPNVAAQEPGLGIEVFASLGAGRYDPYDGMAFYFGPPPERPDQTGLNLGAGIAFRPAKSGEGYSSGFGFEFELNTMRKERGNVTSRITFLTGSALYHFLSHSKVQPYVLLGIGSIYGGRGSNGLALTAGLGGKVFLTPHISIRPEIRLFGSWDNSFIRYSGGICYHW